MWLRVMATAFAGLVASSFVAYDTYGGAGEVCTPKNGIGYVSKETCETCDDHCVNATPLVEASQRAASRGDLDAAIAKMEQAVRLTSRYSRRRIQRWDNLAELYCLRAVSESDPTRAAALRTDGMRLLGEFRCGLAMLQGRQTCALATIRVADDDAPATSWGRVPNAALSPLCFASFCDVGFQRDGDDGEEPVDLEEAQRWSNFDDEQGDVDADAANIQEIERLCRASGARR